MVVGPASRVGQALQLLHGQQVDAAVLDVNIAGELVYPVADAANKPRFALYFRHGLRRLRPDRAYRGRPVLEKPFPKRALLQAMLEAFSDHECNSIQALA